MGPPVVPRTGTRRGRQLARQRADDARGRFNERVLQFAFDSINPTRSETLIQTVTSQGSRYVRCTAMRGTISLDRTVPSLDLILAQTRIRVQLNGQQDLVSGNDSNSVSMAALFDDITSPWLWWLSPILLRAGDRIAITVANTTSSEGSPVIFPEIGLRLIDDHLWQSLYTRDWRRERA